MQNRKNRPKLHPRILRPQANMRRICLANSTGNVLALAPLPQDIFQGVGGAGGGAWFGAPNANLPPPKVVQPPACKGYFQGWGWEGVACL